MGDGMESEIRHQVFRSRLDGSGRIVLPAEVRSDLGLSPGDMVMIVKDGAGVHVETPENARKALQDYFLKLVPAGVSLVDELIAERRAEAERE
jgi:AbrB family looped-hinge helix DNA binding protein